MLRKSSQGAAASVDGWSEGEDGSAGVTVLSCPNARGTAAKVTMATPAMKSGVGNRSTNDLPFGLRPYQSVGTAYCVISGSGVTRVSPPMIV